MPNVESFEVTETTLEQIFQEQIKTKEQKEKTKDELQKALKFNNAAKMRPESARSGTDSTNNSRLMQQP